MKKILITTTILIAMFIIFVPSVNAMQVIIEDVTGNSFDLEVESSDMIDAVKQKIENKMNIPLKQQILKIVDEQFENKQLEDTRSVADYNIVEGDTIKLFYKLTVSTQLINITSNGQNEITNESDYKVTLTADEGYKLPENVSITVGENFLDIENYTYEHQTGELIIPAKMLTGNIVISGEAEMIEDDIENIDNSEILWVEKNINNQKVWFGIDNSNNVFEENSTLWIEEFNKQNNIQEWEMYYKQIDETIIPKINIDKSLMFSVGVRNPNNTEYTTLNNTVNLYIEYPNNWTQNLNAIFISEKIDEKIETKIIDLNFPEGRSQFACLKLNHFSPYIIYAEPYTVTFDANGGIFKDGSNKLILDDLEIEKLLENPTRDGFRFIGYFTKIDGGTSYEKYVAEAGIDGNITFYAQWEENSAAAENGTISQPNNENPSTNSEPIVNANDNPQTGDNIIIYILLLIVSALSIFVINKIKNK